MSTLNSNPADVVAAFSPVQDVPKTRYSGNLTNLSWPQWKKILFRIAFVFFVSISLPWNPEWYKVVFSIDWTNLHYRDPYDVARFGSGLEIFGRTLFGSALNGYATYVITLLFAIAVATVWTLVVRFWKNDPANYVKLNYWLRTIVRYRAGIGIIGFGFTKLLPTQMPFPSLGLLNTDFGDFTLQKIYWLSVGIVPWYQVFAGVVEIAGGVLLFFRKTTFLGAVLLFGALGDIVYVNFAYDGGVHVYSTYFVILSAFLMVQDIPRLYNLFILERFTIPVNYYPVFAKTWQKYARIGVKSAVIGIFLFLFFYLSLVNFLYDPYKQPSTAGIKELRGNYNVTEFRLNNKIIPYSPQDTVRWQWATFEKWTTLTFKVNKPTPLDLSNGGGASMKDISRTFELTGTGGGQRVFHYYGDPVNQVLYLQDKFKASSGRALGVRDATDLSGGAVKPAKNKTEKQPDPNWISKAALVNIGDEVAKIDPRAASTRRDREFAEAPKNEKRNRMVLSYSTTDGSRVILKGIDQHNDSLYVVLDRVNKNYVLPKSTLDAGKYD
jgi:hypothetical protein